MRITMNKEFKSHIKEYQRRPVKAAKYRRGMENGWIVFCCNTTRSIKDFGMHEGVRFFNSEQKAWNYINENPKHYIKVDGQLHDVEVKYFAPEPVLYRKWLDGEEGKDLFSLGELAFLDNESNDYECEILYDSSWIIMESDGCIRVWTPESCDDFFGKDYFCEKRSNKEYIPINRKAFCAML